MDLVDKAIQLLTPFPIVSYIPLLGIRSAKTTIGSPRLGLTSMFLLPLMLEQKIYGHHVCAVS